MTDGTQPIKTGILSPNSTHFTAKMTAVGITGIIGRNKKTVICTKCSGCSSLQIIAKNRLTQLYKKV